MHPIYLSHGYREREAPFTKFFTLLMTKTGFIPSLDPPSKEVNSAKLERHLNYTNGMVAVLSSREEGISPHILYEISIAIRCKKPTLVFVEDSIPESYIPKEVMVKRFSGRSYVRETTDHLYALKQLSTYIGDQQLPRYRGVEYQKSCIIIGDKKINRTLKEEIEKSLIKKGYSLKYLPKRNNILPMSGKFHSDLNETDLAIVILSSSSPINNYTFGALHTSLIPTITLSVGDYPLIDSIPNEYQRRVITNIDLKSDIDIITKQINLYEEDFVELDSLDKAIKYAEKLAESRFPGRYTHEFRTNIIKELTMGDKYEAGQVGAQGPGAHAENMTFNQIWQQNKAEIDLVALKNDLIKLRNSMQQEATSAEHFSEIGAIADAEIEAGKGDGIKALESLAKVGKWGFGIAEKIGVGVATAAIKTTLGV